ncbi:Arsenite efflux pump ArsB, ACR3 family [Actinopolyspora lacussalsi subsp. righensis]|uniref:Arsenite efflux pump ArsB, ACR3 family n=1 Tax=Actinopolyspora righensis TaxID=995060 RepID=A0A1I6Z032_9ACTN|nr:bile acid:sodium symporter [Actinopolyspora righensis]SFT56034.1 Arsenite efflux pump ArsB, ACR3 family [Actinopolyspora righensis]
MSATQWLERHQIPIYLGGLAAGAVVGLALPASAPGWEHAIYPVLGTLLYATFLQVPFTRLTRAFRDGRFLTATLLLNFAVVPLIMAALTAVVTLPRAVLLGVLLVLLTPCIDYVIVFTGLAGGDSHRLLAASPLLMLAQMVALPPLLWLFLGPELADIVAVGPFLEAFGILIVAPLGLAWATEALAARHRTGEVLSSAVGAAMVPLMAATLLVVVASQVPAISHRLGRVVAVVPLYVAFLVIMAGVGYGLARGFRLDAGRSRALIFSGATRNSLVVLPLALALPAGYAITPVVVVTQTLVELLGMVGYVHTIPRLVRSRPQS